MAQSWPASMAVSTEGSSQVPPPPSHAHTLPRLPSVVRFEEACHRTLRWIDRCIAGHKRKDQQNLFGIVQGGLDISPGGLRDISLKVTG